MTIVMTLQDLKGPYSAIFSLGINCLPAMELRAHGLRNMAGPLDWMGTPVLPNVTRLLRNRFQGMLSYPNLTTIDKANDELYNVWDREYDLYMNHDFYIHNNFPPHLAAYPEVKAKYDRRILRFLHKVESGGRILFIRTDSNYEDIKELAVTLEQLVTGPFHLLVVNHLPVPELELQDWKLKHVCVVNMPNQDVWYSNRHRWSFIFDGMWLI